MTGRPHFADVLAYQWQAEEFCCTPEKFQEFIRSGGILDQPHVYERRRPNGTVLEIRSTPLPGGGVVRTYTDVTERKAAEERVDRGARPGGGGTRRGRTGEPGEDRVPGQHLARDPHADERHHRHERTAAAQHASPRPQRDCALTVRDSAAALLRVIDDVLDISKLEAGRMELDPIDFDLAETIEATAALLAPRAGRRASR